MTNVTLLEKERTAVTEKQRHTVRRLVKLGTVATLLFAASALQAEPVCSQATMSGTYVSFGGGTMGASSNGTSAVATIARVTYDGRGGGNASFTQSVAGVTQKGTATATYAVNADCTGSKNFGGPGGLNYDFVVTADGREIFWIITNPGRVLSGRAIRLDNSRN
jgi:hypothetical protein